MSDHLAIVFGGHWSSASEDINIKYLICHVTSQNHVTERLNDLVNSVAIGIVTKR